MSLPVEEFLTEDGSIDKTAVARHSQTNADDPRYVDAETCAKIRRALVDAPNANSVCDRFGITTTPVREHARGLCSHNTDEPTLTYDRKVGAWVVDETDTDQTDQTHPPRTRIEQGEVDA